MKNNEIGDQIKNPSGDTQVQTGVLQQPFESTPQQHIEPTSPPKNKRRLVVGFIVLLSFIGTNAFFVYRYFQTNQAAQLIPSPTLLAEIPTPTAIPDPTANWNTYSGDNFSFKYPSDLLTKELPIGNISLYQNQEFLKKSKTCTYLGQLNDPCPPPVFNIYYTSYPKSKIGSVEELDAEVGGGIVGQTSIIKTVSGKDITVGTPMGLELRPDIRSYSQNKNQYISCRSMALS